MSLTKVSYSMISGTSANVLDFGAVGDGNTANAAVNKAAFQAAVNASRSVYVPSGTYYIDGRINIPANTTIFGNGGAISVIKGVVNFPREGGTYDYASMFYSENSIAKNCTILNLGFDFNKSAYVTPPTAETQIAVLFPTGCDNLLIQGCTFSNQYTGSAILAGGTGSKIIECSFLDMGFDQIGAQNTNPIQLNIGANQTLVSNCYFDSTTDFFIGIEPQAHNLTITGNIFHNKYVNAGGAAIGGFGNGPITNIVISNNTINVSATPGYGIYLGAGGAATYKNVTIINNTIFAGKAAAINVSPVVPFTTGSYDSIVIKGNTIYGNLTTGIATQSAIQFGDTLSGSAPITNINISDNVVQNYNGPAIYINNPSKVTIKNNVMADCALINSEKCPVKLVTNSYSVFSNIAVLDNAATDTTGWTTNLVWVDAAKPSTVSGFFVRNNTLQSSSAGGQILANSSAWYTAYQSQSIVAGNAVNGVPVSFSPDTIYTDPSNKGVRFATCTGDGGTNTVVSYFVTAFGASNSSGCIGAWSSAGVFNSPGDSISSSDTYQIFGWISV